MKQIVFALSCALLFNTAINAQLSNGGLPSSLHTQYDIAYFPVHDYPLPDWQAALEKDKQQEDMGISRPFLIGLFVAADISFPEAGSFTSIEKGKTIWKTQVHIADAPAIGFYFDRFHLPEGVQLFLSNANNQQILGAYTAGNNNDDGLFATEAVQGEMINIELNIEDGVNMEAISLHVDQLLVYFRSISYLGQYAGQDFTPVHQTGQKDPYDLEGSSSTCGINAVCPEGHNYVKQRKSTLQIIVPSSDRNSVGLCSATMINNTGNTDKECKQYVLTASHCEGSNSMSSNPFSQILFRFNFESEQCASLQPATVNTLSGATFIARSDYVATSQPKLDGDFLLMELRQRIPADWDVYLSGWNRSSSLPGRVSAPKKYIGFHHPAGDIKKVSTAQSVYPNGWAGGSDGPGTHWQVMVESGGIQGGSSGSSLFDGEGRTVGIASTAGDEIPGCSLNGKGETVSFVRYVTYGKMSYSWDYTRDGNQDYRKLKPWLDPVNSGVIITDPVKSTCSDLASDVTAIKSRDWDDAFRIYPNPVTDGRVNLQANLKNRSNLKVELFDLTGALKNTYQLHEVQAGTFTFDLGDYANGLYLLKVSDGQSTVGKKIMVAR